VPTTSANTFTNDELLPWYGDGRGKTDAIKLKASTVFRKGDALYELAASPRTYAQYLAGNTDGTGASGAPVPVFLLKRACATDAGGNISFSTVAGVSDQGQTSLTAAAFYKGAFAIKDLPASGAGSLDAAGRAAMGRMIEAGQIIDLL
jgi:hypothetical protein